MFYAVVKMQPMYRHKESEAKLLLSVLAEKEER